jgi:Na+/proline symporter
MIGAIFAIISVTNGIPGGIGEILAIADEKAKLTLIDLSMDLKTTYTIWVALFAVTVFELGQNTIDQIVVQRSLTCKNAHEAQKAIYFGLLGNIPTYIMLVVGLGLVAFYQVHPLDPQTASVMQETPDRIFPYYIVTQMPPGVSGIIIASIFAAGISTLDSALTALSEASLSGFYKRYLKKTATEKHYLLTSKWFVVFWGILLSGMAIWFYHVQEEGLLELGLGLPGYVYGSLFGIALLSFWGRGNFTGIAIGTVLSIIVVVALSIAGVTFFWWYMVACMVLLVVAVSISKMMKAGVVK